MSIIHKIKVTNAPIGASLNEWLKFTHAGTRLACTHFPNDDLKSQYLAKVKTIREPEVKALLRKFIPKTGYRPCEYKLYSDLMKNSSAAKKGIVKTEYWHRISSYRSDTMEGLTWVLDLLPGNPEAAVSVLEAYLKANGFFLWTEEEFSLTDSIEIIKAKYFDFRHQVSDFHKFLPSEFEWLIETLYSTIGYETKVTKKTRDRGIDIFLINEKIGKKERSLIQCKRQVNSIGVSAVRDLLGTVSSEKASKGILITTSSFTKPAIKFAEANSCIELIDREKLNFLLNIHLGTDWHMNKKYLSKIRDRARSGPIANSIEASL